MSNRRADRSSSAAAPSAATSVAWPMPRMWLASIVRMFFSSSTMRTEAMRVLSAVRDFESEASAPADGAFQMDAATVGQHDVANDREAEARRAGLARRRHLRIPFEDSVLLFGRNPGTGIGDGDRDRPVAGGKLDSDGTTGRGVANRVGDQVRERPRELRFVADDGQTELRAAPFEDDALL